ncbi:hypothetical protein IC006_0664 [Sulfuracidifex tepidarius]|uniref:Uncharacterized protein n=1 Tax=Sulfuracidifex tepidarius TaxID=1294262 RepID=A0A510DTG5_9CREN|nr:hypothetical protein [Sulfuracidifex tepidarius]BBG23380.1 hypothetical protein IC006_0664 [Sulfuracidifex tepidarius]
MSLSFTYKEMGYTLVIHQEGDQNVDATLLGNVIFYYSSPYTNVPSLHISTSPSPSFLVSNYFSNGSVKLYVSTLHQASLSYDVTNYVHSEQGETSSLETLMGNQSEGIKSYIIKVKDHTSTLVFHFLSKSPHVDNSITSETSENVTSGLTISIDELREFEDLSYS